MSRFRSSIDYEFYANYYALVKNVNVQLKDYLITPEDAIKYFESKLK